MTDGMRYRVGDDIYTYQELKEATEEQVADLPPETGVTASSASTTTSLSRCIPAPSRLSMTTRTIRTMTGSEARSISIRAVWSPMTSCAMQ
jgi:hypothetical protein